jgi:hypothetical protein
MIFKQYESSFGWLTRSEINGHWTFKRPVLSFDRLCDQTRREGKGRDGKG